MVWFEINTQNKPLKSCFTFFWRSDGPQLVMQIQKKKLRRKLKQWAANTKPKKKQNTMSRWFIQGFIIIVCTHKSIIIWSMPSAALRKRITFFVAGWPGSAHDHVYWLILWSSIQISFHYPWTWSILYFFKPICVQNSCIHCWTLFLYIQGNIILSIRLSNRKGLL